MRALLRRQVLTGLLAATGLCAGCGDLGQTLYFFMPEQKTPADVKSLASDDKKKEVRAMILVRNSPETNFEFMGADRELARSLHKQLTELVEANDQHLTLIPTAKVDAFKSSTPRWYEIELNRIGEHFKVDYIIYLEVNQLSVNTTDMTLRARADVSVRLIDVKHPDDSTSPKTFSCSYPSESNFQLADPDTPVQEFREKFLTYAAKRLAWYFAPHPVRDSHYIE